MSYRPNRVRHPASAELWPGDQVQDDSGRLGLVLAVPARSQDGLWRSGSGWLILLSDGGPVTLVGSRSDWWRVTP